MTGIDQRKVDKTTELYLDKIENKTKYNRWYCGHYHIEKKIDKIKFMSDNIELFYVYKNNKKC